MKPVFLVMGDASVLVDREVARIEAEALVECGLPAFNHGRWRVSDDDPMDAIRTAQTLPMMAGRRLVVLRDLHDAKATLLEALVEYVGNPSETTVLVLTGTKFARPRKGSKDWGTRLRNAVKKAGEYIVFDSSKTDPVRFACDHAASIGATMGRQTADMLVAVVGADLATIAREVEKVALYAADASEVTPEHVAAACSALAEEDAWALSGAIAVGDMATAVGVLQPLLEQDDSSGRIRMVLGQLGWQLRQVAVIADGLAAGRSDRDIAGAVKGYGKWDLIRTARRAHEQGRLKRPARILEGLAVANRHMNSHRAGDRRILESLVIDLCS